MSRIHPLVACLVVCAMALFATPVRADVPGTYSYTQDVDGGKIQYTLSLDEDGDAKLTSERKDQPRVTRENVDNYGRIVRLLDRKSKIVHSGRWSRRAFRDNEFRVAFEDMDVSDNVNQSMDVRGKVDGNRLTLTDWRTNLYGNRTRFVFERNRSRNNDALIAGAAVIALGAIIANNSRGNASDDFNFSQLNHRTRGRGDYAVEGRRTRISQMSFELRRDGSAKIGVTLDGDGFYVEGRWSRIGGNRIRFNAEKAFDRERMTGSGTLYLRNSREVERVDLDYRGRDDGRQFSINFTTDGGSSSGSSDNDFNFSQLNHRTGGRGDYAVEGRRTRISQMSFELRRDGSAKIGVTLDGDGFYVEGRWSRIGGNRIRFNAEKAFDRERMTGSGTLYLRNSREVERVDLDYHSRDDGRQFLINFTSNRG